MNPPTADVDVPEHRGWWSPLPAWLHREMALVGGTLYITGGFLVLLPLVFLFEQLRWPPGIVGVGVVAVTVGASFLASANRWILPLGVYVVATGLGAALITIAVAAGGRQLAVSTGVLYVFVSAYGFYYYPDRAAALDVGIGAVGYAVVLAPLFDPIDAVYVWLVITLAAVVSGVLTARLGRRARGLLGQERQLTAALHEASRAKTALLQTVSHDLRAPLSSVIGALMTVLHDRERLTPALRHELLTRSLNSAQRMHRILNDLLDMERIAAGDLTLRPQPERLDELVSDVLAATDFDQHHCRTYLNEVVADVERTRMERVIDNLVANAIRHTPPGTVVAVTVDRAPDGRPRLIVEDNGPGVPIAARSEMFTAFGSSNSATPGSTGLGLSLAARFTELHGGALTYEEVDGGGARFVVELPLPSAG